MERFAGIPYDERAMMYALSDISSFEIERRKKEALEIFFELSGFFTDSSKLPYLLANLSTRNIIDLLNRVEKVLVSAEDYEKCSLVMNWKQQLHEQDEV